MGDNNQGGTRLADIYNQGRVAVGGLTCPVSKEAAAEAQETAAKYDRLRQNGTLSRRDFI